jgi:hypothetical protein
MWTAHNPIHQVLIANVEQWIARPPQVCIALPNEIRAIKALCLVAQLFQMSIIVVTCKQTLQ